MNEDRDLEEGFAAVSPQRSAPDRIRAMAQVLVRAGSAETVRAQLARPTVEKPRPPVGVEDAAMLLGHDDVARRRGG